MATTDMPVTVTQAPGANLIANSGFETDATGWESTTAFGAYTAAALTRSTVRFHGGAASLLATWPTGPASVANVTPFITTVIGVTYTATAWVYVPTGSPDVQLRTIFGAYGAATSVKDAWVPLTLTFVATTTGPFVGVDTVTAPTAGQQCFIDDAFFKTALMVKADGADTPCPAAVTDAAVYAVNDRVQATIRTPQMPLITGKVSAE